MQIIFCTFKKMKKFSVAILAFLYITTSTGAAFHVHYCMGNYTDWGFGQNNAKTCSNCGMTEMGQKDKGCCKDENKFLKNDTDQKNAGPAFQPIKVIAVSLPTVFAEMAPGVYPSGTGADPIHHSPPRSCGVAVYIRNCVFLI